MNHWSQYWKLSKAVNSFAEGSSASGYHGDVEAFWQNELAESAERRRHWSISALAMGALAMLISEAGKKRQKRIGKFTVLMLPKLTL